MDKMVSNNTAVGELLFSLPKKIKDTSLRSDVLLRACPKNDNVCWQSIGALAFARRQILQQSSTLIIHLYFLQVVLSVLF